MMAINTTAVIYKIFLLESRILEYASKKRLGFWRMIKELSYAKHSWRIIRLMLQISPWNTAVVVLGRFVEGLIPSLELRVKGEFLELV